MTHVSDILAFATQHPDYWGELLDTNQDLPPELTKAEQEALEAAIDHIEDAVEALLHLVGERLGERYSGEIHIPAFRSTATRRNRAVRIAPPDAIKAAMYHVEFSLEESWGGKDIQLFPAIIVKRGSLDGILRRLDKLGVKYDHDEAYNGYKVFGPGLALSEGRAFDDLAESAAGSACELLRGVVG